MAAEFDTSHVKNVVLLGHAGSGKTTLSECLLFEAGIINRRGTVEEKNTVSDYHELEQIRGNSIFSTLLHTKWKGYKINIIDTPGYDDFVGEVVSALRVADTGVLVLNACHGVEVGSETIWEYTELFKTPTILAVNFLDHEKADFDTTLEQARSRFGNSVVEVQYPIYENGRFAAIIDVLNMVMYSFGPEGGKPTKAAIPDAEKEKAERIHKELVEAIAEHDETLMEHYFENGTLTEDEMRNGLKAAMIHHDLFPLFCLSAKNDMGGGRLMSFIDNVCPSANEMPAQVLPSNETLACDSNGPACIFIYKTVSEAHLGEMSFFKVFSGTVTAGMDLVNESNGVSEKINQLFVVEGQKRTPVTELTAGDIGATIKLKHTHTNNTLHVKGKNIELHKIQFPRPNMRFAIEATNKGEDEKMSIALHQLQEEDPTIVVEVSPELRQTLLYCQGELHLNVIKWKLEHVFKVQVSFNKPRISYRETIRKSVQSNYRHKKQSGGAGQFGEVTLIVEPYFEHMEDPKGVSVRGREKHELPWGGELHFLNCIVGGAIDLRFMPSILKGIMEKMHEGPLTGSFVRDVRVSVIDGKMHPVDSNDISFKIAGMRAFKDAFKTADPEILEPIYMVEVLCPDDLTGAIMGELQTRRGMIEGMDTQNHYQKIVARVPLSEMHDYSSTLRSISQGRARYSMEFLEYAMVPFEIQKKLIEEYSKHQVDEV